MERNNIYSKETLLVYLMNELSSGSYEVTTYLAEDGCWDGKISIQVIFESKNEDSEYYKRLAEKL